MKVITLDIESTSTHPVEIDRYTEKPKFPPIDTCIPEVIAWIVSDFTNSSIELFIRDRNEADESAILQDLGETIESCDRVVTWNGRGFDMPLLNLRAMLFKVDWSFWPTMSHRFPNYRNPLRHWDMQDVLSDGGMGRSFSLDRTSKLFGYGKKGVEGETVMSLLNKGMRREVAEYCANDTFITLMMYVFYQQSHHKAKIESPLKLLEEFSRANDYLKKFY